MLVSLCISLIAMSKSVFFSNTNVLLSPHASKLLHTYPDLWDTRIVIISSFSIHSSLNLVYVEVITVVKLHTPLVT